MLFSAVPADEHACSAIERAVESEICFAASLHLDTALLELELLLPHPAASSPQTISTSTDPMTRPIPDPPVVVGASLHAAQAPDPPRAAPAAR
jgi:hypothetical protein